MAYGEVFVNRRDIEAKLSKVGDYVKIDFLNQCLKKNLDFDTKKFVLLKLAEVYESRRMFLEAAKLYRTAADINTTFNGKISDFMRSMNLFIQAGSFGEAEISYAKAIASANELQKAEIKQTRKKSMLAYADEHIKKEKRRQAMEAYEVILTFDLNPIERQDIQKKLLIMYEKLGRIKEYSALKNSMQRVNQSSAGSNSSPSQNTASPSQASSITQKKQPTKGINQSIDELFSSLS